jgi:acetylornithine aminotransferase
VALTVCQTLEKENILQNVQDRGEQLRDGLSAIAAKYPHHITEVRGWGLINGMELSADIPLTAPEVVTAAINEGLLLVPAGPKVVRFVPPLIVTEAEVNAALQIVEQAIATVTA